MKGCLDRCKPCPRPVAHLRPSSGFHWKKRRYSQEVYVPNVMKGTLPRMSWYKAAAAVLIITNSTGRCCRQESRTASEDSLGQMLLASEQPGRHHLCSELQEANKSDLTLRQHLLEGDQQACKDSVETTDLLVSADGRL